MINKRLVRAPAGLLCLSILGCGGEASRLIAELRHDDANVRLKAARALADPVFAGDERVVAALTAAIDDSDPAVQEAVVTTLVTFGEAGAPALPALEGLLTSRDPAVQLAAARAISRIEPESTNYRPALIESLRAGHAPLFLEVQEMPDAQWAVPTLVELLSDSRTHVRALSAQALGNIGHADDEVIAALKRRLQDGEIAVRRAAKAALDHLQATP
jgi:HEAT repeat protein